MLNWADFPSATALPDVRLPAWLVAERTGAEAGARRTDSSPITTLVDEGHPVRDRQAQPLTPASLMPPRRLPDPDLDLDVRGWCL